MWYNNCMEIKNLLAAVCVVAAGVVFADSTPVMVSLVNPLQVPSSSYDVEGLRLSLIYGQCANLTGLDIGIVNNTRSDFAGVALGGANIAGGKMRGGQIGLVNVNKNAISDWGSRSIGAQIGLVNYANSFCGVQDGVVNVSSKDFSGLQSSFLNTTGSLQGAQLGFYVIFAVNVADRVTGCQIGLVNYAGYVDSGLQIGLVNINKGNGWAPVLPIVNGGF